MDGGIINEERDGVFSEGSLARAKSIKVRRLSIADARAGLSKIARQAHDNGEYFFVGGNGTPMIGIMDAEEMEDYLELRDPAVQARIEQSNEDISAGRTRPAAQLLEEARKNLGRKAPGRRPRK